MILKFTVDKYNSKGFSLDFPIRHLGSFWFDKIFIFNVNNTTEVEIHSNGRLIMFLWLRKEEVWKMLTTGIIDTNEMLIGE